jgi:hypothetical protein
MFGRKLRTPHAIARRRKLRMVFFAAGAVALGLVLWGIIELMRIPAVRIDSIEVYGAQAISEEGIEQIIRARMDGSYFGIIPRDNTFFYPRRTIEAALRDEFPRMRELTLSRDGMQTVLVTVSERQPHALWCGDIVPSVADIVGTANQRCYFLDVTGFIFGQSPSFSGTPYHRFYGAIAQSRAIGQPFLPEDEYTALFDFMTALRTADIPIYGVLVVDDIDLELYLTDGARLLVRRDDDHTRVLERIRTVLASEEFSAYETEDVEYIDMRFGNRVYFRPRTEPLRPSTGPAVNVPTREEADEIDREAPADFAEVGVASVVEEEDEMSEGPENSDDNASLDEIE